MPFANRFRQVQIRRVSLLKKWVRHHIILSSIPVQMLSKPAVSFGPFAEYWRSLGVVFVRPDFVGSKREMSPNRARHLARAAYPFAVQSWCDSLNELTGRGEGDKTVKLRQVRGSPPALPWVLDPVPASCPE